MAAAYLNRRYYVPFLNHCLEASKDNILQENFFYILTSEEIIALTCFLLFCILLCVCKFDGFLAIRIMLELRVMICLCC